MDISQFKSLEEIEVEIIKFYYAEFDKKIAFILGGIRNKIERFMELEISREVLSWKYEDENEDEDKLEIYREAARELFYNESVFFNFQVVQLLGSIQFMSQSTELIFLQLIVTFIDKTLITYDTYNSQRDYVGLNDTHADMLAESRVFTLQKIRNSVTGKIKANKTTYNGLMPVPTPFDWNPNDVDPKTGKKHLNASVTQTAICIAKVIETEQLAFKSFLKLSDAICSAFTFEPERGNTTEPKASTFSSTLKRVVEEFLREYKDKLPINSDEIIKEIQPFVIKYAS